MPHYYPVVFPAGRSLAGDSLGFHAYSLRVDNCTNQWYLEESTVSYIPPYSLGMCLRLYGTGVAILLSQAPVGQPQLAPIAGEQVVGVYSDQLRTEVAGVPIRNFSLIQTVSDFQQGPQPAAPPNNTTRLWADAAGNMHRLLPNGQDALIVDSTTALGGDVTGTIQNTIVSFARGNMTVTGTLYLTNTNAYLLNVGNAIRYAALGVHSFESTGGGYQSLNCGALGVNGNGNVTGALTVGGLTTGNGGATFHGDVTVDRSNTLGYVWFGNNSSHYIGFDGNNWQCVGPGAFNFPGDVLAQSGSVACAFGGKFHFADSNNRYLYMDNSRYRSGSYGNSWEYHLTSNGVLLSWQHGQATNGGWGFVFQNYILQSAGQAICVAGNNLNGQALYCNGGAGGAGGWNVISSKRWKSNIMPILGALETVLHPDLRGVHYTLDAPDCPEQQDMYGFIAEAWLGHAPDVVDLDEHGEVRMMDYGQVTPILFEAFKTYVARTDARLAALEARG